MGEVKVDINELKQHITEGSYMSLARALTLVENDIYPAQDFLKSLRIKQDIPVIGITGPPGAGKSTLVNAMLAEVTQQNKRVAVLAVDPTSPFNYGSLLGDRIRMSRHFNNPNVYIRSVATRGSLGGLSASIIEMVDVLRACNFDLIIVETVGVGQSEIEIAGLADKTILVLVPEAGDEIQHIKSGLMEVAQAFVVNKSDRDGADLFANRLLSLVKEKHQQTPVFKTVADKAIGIQELVKWILRSPTEVNEKRNYLLAEKAFRLIQNRRMKDVDKAKLFKSIYAASTEKMFNIYNFIERYI